MARELDVPVLAAPAKPYSLEITIEGHLSYVACH